MKKSMVILCAMVLIVVITGRVSAFMIVDTGTPVSWPDAAGDPILDFGKSLAGQFSVIESSQVTSIEGYLSSGNNGASGGTFSVALYSDGGSVPGCL